LSLQSDVPSAGKASEVHASQPYTVMLTICSSRLTLWQLVHAGSSGEHC